MGKIDVRNLDSTTKLAVLAFFIAAAYGIFFFALKPIFSPTVRPFSGGMGSGMMSFSTNSSSAVNIISIILALGGAAGFSYYLFHSHRKKTGEEEYLVMRRALSDDERKLMDEIQKSGEITQDSLRFRLNWSKAKVSTHLTNLDKSGIIQRERTGKTYNVFLQKGKL
ncbi:winged helix-turn-helix transcriptional regulator [Candidatus Woesearchaeota archaeon]|nr:winged helix-turn-helix transcriptional regulator [Candidatus Woesearchaeota archaeon]